MTRYKLENTTHLLSPKTDMWDRQRTPKMSLCSNCGEKEKNKNSFSAFYSQDCLIGQPKATVLTCVLLPVTQHLPCHTVSSTVLQKKGERYVVSRVLGWNQKWDFRVNKNLEFQFDHKTKKSLHKNTRTIKEYEANLGLEFSEST